MLCRTSCFNIIKATTGMKKTFRTIIDISAADHQRIFFSGGRIGCQIETTLDGLAGIIEFSLADIAQR